MSRRKEKAWEAFIGAHSFGGGGEREYFVDWESAARALGFDYFDFVEYDPVNGSQEVDVPGLRDAVRLNFDEPNGEEPPPLVMLTLRCQRCDRRLDTMRVRATHWSPPTPGSNEGWKLSEPRITSEAWQKQVGDSTSELFRKFEGRSIGLECACGRQDIQFSLRRIREEMERLLPDNPRWSPGGDDAVIMRPATRHATIRG